MEKIYPAACVSAVILVSFFIIGPDPMFMIGALTGCLLMIYKSVFWRNMPAGFSGNKKRPVRTFFFNMIIQLLTGLALLAAVIFNALFFFGMAAGMLAAIAGIVIGALRAKI